ncbi:ClpP/crotonase-like domain-containing protein [Vararia minispora EC-137]|uniref:ClpP/crotonase-like domain-containing protein n=1 Tax=Vararia minispora EC-137 TaxID=1314806 RepID=A0ACB8QQI6_9AGAM|nr:ClpP/crotonase-like domain-containing protein [Vararia minispora EC-137]
MAPTPPLPEYTAEFQFLKLSYPSPGVMHVELNRYWREFEAAFSRISLDSTVRAIVLSSALPKLFCGGVDLSFLQSLNHNTDAGRSGLLIRQMTTEFQHAVSAPERCPYPVIAATHGKVIGLGVDILAACDIRWTAEDAVFSIKEAAVGLAADVGSLARLPKIVGNSSLLFELALTARDFSAQEAKDLGLVSNIVEGGRDEVVGAALGLASRIAQLSPLAALGTKRFLLHAREHSTQSTLEYEATWNMGVLQGPDMVQTATAAIQKKGKVDYAPLAPWLKPITKL